MDISASADGTPEWNYRQTKRKRQGNQYLGAKLVEAGGIEPPSASPTQADLHT